MNAEKPVRKLDRVRVLVAPNDAASVRETPDSPAALSSVRVLLAEDNPINQDVAQTMLESLGCQVCVVETGAKALAALASGQFDIVLMDCRMPEMDGFDAAAEIRARGLLRPKQAPRAAEPVRLPIVGITASALKGEREICIAAGMDDCLAKPFRRDALRLVLERWVLDRAAGHVEEDVATDAAQPSTFDSAVLDRMSSIQRPGDSAMVAGLIDRYFASAAQSIDALHRACERSDVDALASTAHWLGSSSGFLGAQKLALLCSELEQACLAGETQGHEQRIVRIQQEFDAVRIAMKTVEAESKSKP